MDNRPTVFKLTLGVLTGLFLVSVSFGSGFAVASIQPRQTQLASTTQPDTPHKKVPASLDVFVETWDLVVRDFFGPLPTNRERVYGAVRGLLGTLGDPYTVFVEPITHQFEQDDLRGSYGGIGVDLGRNSDNQIVLTPFRDSPAAEVGILDGDVLLSVDGLQITPEMDFSRDIAARLRGEVGTEVTLSVLRGESFLTFTITRQVIEIPSVTWRILEQAPSLGYVHIKSFTDRTVDELKRGLNDLRAHDLSGLVVDLRGNGGGLLQSAIDVADQFLDGGPVLYEKRKNEDEQSYVANSDGSAQDIGIVLLVDHGTASAAEIVAGALQDRGRGILVGEPTFGKGSVQLIFDLSDGSSLHVTTARWYTPNRHQLDGVGLTPDILVGSEPESGTDTQLERAIGYLQNGE